MSRSADGDLIRSLEERGASVVPVLLPLVLSENEETSSRAAAAIRMLMTVLPRGILARIDESCRSWWPLANLDTTAWRALRPRDVHRLAARQKATSDVIGVASFHPDGHVREAAVETLDQATDGAELPYLLLRVNDWVTRVADRALEAVTRRVVPAYGAAFVANLQLVVRLSATTRHDHDRLLSAVFALLKDPAQRPALQLGLRSSDRLTSRYCHRLAREGAGADIVQVLERSLESHDTLVRFEAARQARTQLDPAALAELLAVLERDPFPAVRREGLLAAFERARSDASERARRALFDPNRSIRELARFVLSRELPGLAADAYYRATLGTEDPRRLATALAGLGETGDRSDAQLVAPFVTHHRVAVRKSAIRALGRLDAAPSAAVLLAALADPSPGVSHAARDALLANPALYDAETVAGLVRTVPYVHGMLDAVALADTLGKWPSLVLLLEASASDQLAVANAARAGLERWTSQSNRRFAPPRPSEVAAVTAALEQCRFAIEDRLAGEIAAAVRPWLPDGPR